MEQPGVGLQMASDVTERLCPLMRPNTAGYSRMPPAMGTRCAMGVNTVSFTQASCSRGILMAVMGPAAKDISALPSCLKHTCAPKCVESASKGPAGLPSRCPLACRLR